MEEKDHHSSDKKIIFFLDTFLDGSKKCGGGGGGGGVPAMACEMCIKWDKMKNCDLVMQCNAMRCVFWLGQVTFGSIIVYRCDSDHRSWKETGQS